MERNVLTRYNHSNATDDTSSFMQPSGKVLAEYERGQKVIKAVMNHPKVSDKDFWALYLAHLSFLCKDYQQASALIDSVRTTKPKLLKQKSRTQFSLYLAQLKFIGTDEEKRSANTCKRVMPMKISSTKLSVISIRCRRTTAKHSLLTTV